MGITRKGADHLNQSLMAKLDIHSRIELVRFAINEHIGDECGVAPDWDV